MRDICRIDLATTPPFRTGALCVEPALRQASTAVTEPETLEPRVMLVLVALARTRGTIVSRDQLIEQCWDSRVVGDDSINRVISRLRKLATAHGEALFSIETISKVGYRLVGSNPDDPAESEASVGAVPAASKLPATVTRSLRARPFVIAATAALAIIAVLTGISLWPASAANDGVVELAITTSAGPGTAPGVAQALRDEMGSVYGSERLRIVDGSQQVARLSARIGNMGGEQIVFGELRPPGDGPAIWKPRIPLRDAGAIKGAALQLMGGAVCVLQPELTRAPVNRSPVAVSAWASYCDENSTDNPNNIRQIETLRMAVKAEPRFFDAQSTLALMLGVEAQGQPGPLADAMRAEGLRASNAAALIDPRQSRIHQARANLTAETDFTGFAAEVRLALSARSSGWENSQLQGHFLFSVGKLNEALAAHRQALAVVPGNPIDTLECARLLAATGRYAEARQVFEQQAQAENDRSLIDWQWLIAAIAAHDWDNAGRLVGKVALVDQGKEAMAKLVTGMAASNANMVQDAGQQFEELAANPATLSGASVYGLAYSGCPAAAVNAAGRLFEAKGRITLRLLYTPAFAPARQTPEFAAFVTRIGLADYWRKSGNLPDFCLSPGAPALCATLRRRG